MAQGSGQPRDFNDGGFSGVSNCAMGQAIDGISARERGGICERGNVWRQCSAIGLRFRSQFFKPWIRIKVTS
jgi:hypothetical protein